MNRNDAKKYINEYLAAEFGLDSEVDPPDENWPFDLDYIGRIDDTDYYRFDDFGDVYYATWSPDLVCFDSAENIASSEAGARLREMENRQQAGSFIRNLSGLWRRR